MARFHGVQNKIVSFFFNVCLIIRHFCSIVDDSIEVTLASCSHAIVVMLYMFLGRITSIQSQINFKIFDICC